MVMRSEEEVRDCLEAWKSDPVVRDPEYKGKPAKLLVDLLSWVVGDK